LLCIPYRRGPARRADSSANHRGLIAMYSTPFERIKDLLGRIKKLEDKLMNTAVLPMTEQVKIHAEIRKHKEEMAVLERRTRK
jgi:hypothetical protein